MASPFLFTVLPRLLGVLVLVAGFSVSGWTEPAPRAEALAGANEEPKPLSAVDRSHLSADPLVRHAWALVDTGRFATALAILRPLLATHPAQTEVRFLLGLVAIEAAQQPETTDEATPALLAEAIRGPARHPHRPA